MHRLVLLKLEEKCVQGFEIVGGRVRIEVEYSGEREAEEEVVGGTAGEITRRKGRESGQILFGEEERVEPVDAPLVTATGQQRADG